ncbi:helix-turn-helix transcriptional regulator [Pedobacter alpinus]|uniref:helix-turn-helix transcriptional regulator n=1 Tax=Pedobacter alpinus TaxID=1590643 RepID=UPI00360EF92D
MNSSKSNLLMGETLRKLRVNKKQSQEFVADCLNISRTAYKDWENGKIDFSFSKLERISEFFEVPLADLLDKVTPPPLKNIEAS